MSNENNINNEKHPNPGQRWRNRRRLAYLSFLSGSLAVFLPMAMGAAGVEFATPYVELLKTISVPYILGCFGIIAAYVGAASWVEKK